MTDPDFLVVTRHRPVEGGASGFVADADAALEALAARPGFIDGQVGRSVDDARDYVVISRWRDVGSYRRALSAYDVKVAAVPLLSTCIDEQSSFEVLHSRTPDGSRTPMSSLAADAFDVSLGEAAAPIVPPMPS